MYEGCYPGWVLFKRLFDDDFLSISSRNSTRRIIEINPFKIFARKRNSKSQAWFNREYFWSISSSFEPIHWWNENYSCWYSNNSEHRRKIFGNFVSKNVTRRTSLSNTRRQPPGVDFKCRILFGLSQGEFLTVNRVWWRWRVKLNGSKPRKLWETHFGNNFLAIDGSRLNAQEWFFSWPRTFRYEPFLWCKIWTSNKWVKLSLGPKWSEFKIF